MEELKVIILAAGKGTRMKSDLPKVLHEIDGKAMVEYVMEAATEAGAQSICLVVGHGAELVKEKIGHSVEYAVQEEQLGTGHAVKCALDFIGETGDVLVLCGDTPLITGATLKELIQYHRHHALKATVLSAILEDSTGYGRILRDEQGHFTEIVEQKDANEEQLEIKEINGGMYVFQAAALKESLMKLTNNNAQGEYYLTDTIEIIRQGAKHVVVDAKAAKDMDEIRGVNTTEQLAEAAKVLGERK